jgi:ferredoxin-type protein NapH
MKRQKKRKTILLISMLLFPITLNYLSPYLIIMGSFSGIVTGSCLLFASLFLSSLVLGRAFCGWICPAGALQDCCSQISAKSTNKKQNFIKYFIWIPWLITIIMGFITAGGVIKVEPFYMTDHGISVSNIYNYITYFFVVGLILIISLLFGRRSFCHSLCWMAPFMIVGNRIKNKFKYPSLHLEGNANKCVHCKLCDRNCPMSLNVSEMVSSDNMNKDECILCGNCQDVCPQKVIYLGMKSKAK